MGIIMGLISLWLNFLILKQIRKKIIFLGMMLQNKIRDKYLGLAIEFSRERDSKIDLKVFSESILVVAESIFLPLYLAITRLIIIAIYHRGRLRDRLAFFSYLFFYWSDFWVFIFNFW